MTETFSRWDAADQLRTREDARLYLEACADEDPGDGSLIRAVLNDVARAATWPDWREIPLDDWYSIGVALCSKAAVAIGGGAVLRFPRSGPEFDGAGRQA